jgi:acyl carrier protein
MTNIESRVHNVVVDEAGLERAAIGFRDDLTTDHGVDDLDLMKIAMRLEEVFGVEVSDDALQQERTVANCVDIVRERLGPA